MSFEKVSLREKIGYGLGDAASSMFWKIFGMYALFFYTDVFGITAAAAGSMFLVVRLIDSATDLFVGILSDRTTSRWGKYRPYILWFAVPFAAMGTITFFTPDFGQAGKLTYAYVTYSLMMLVYSFVNVPYASLLGVVSPDPNQRNTLSSYRMSFAFIGSFITFMLLQPLIDFFARTFDVGSATQASDSSVSTSAVGWVLGVASIGTICVILFLLCFRWTKERVTQIETDKSTSVKQDLKELFRNGPWWILVATGLAALLFNAIRDSVAIYFFRDFVGLNYKMSGTGWDMATTYFLVGQAGNLIGVMLAPTLSAKYGKKRTYMIAVFMAGIFSALFYLIPKNFFPIMAFQFVISLFAGYVLPLLWSMFADVVDYHEFITGRRTTGLIFSSSSMSQKLGWAFGSALSGWILATFRYSPNAVQQSAETLFGQHLMMSLIPATCCLLAFVGMMFYPLSDKRVKEITEELNLKRQHAG